ncbi:hypothetical protein D3C85_1425690 [compost metagenome]
MGGGVGLRPNYIYKGVLCSLLGFLKKALLIYSIGVILPSLRVRDSSVKPTDKCNAMKRGADLKRIARP